MKIQHKKQITGFTVIELIVVIVVIGILAGISIVSYGAWRHSATAASVKSDLNNVISAMESARTFNNSYPSTLPSSVVASNGNVLTESATDGTFYCVDGTNSNDSSVAYYVASETKSQGPLSGTCATRPTITAPSVPANLAITSAVGTTIGLSWTAAPNAATYNAQCASDAAFIVGLQNTTVSSPTVTATISNLSPSNSYYCRVDAINVNGTSAWSTSVSTTTTNAYGSLAVGTSIDGYWTSAPQGFLLENGAAVSRTTYSDLFAVIGTTYGAGDGSTTFNLPDSRGRTAVNKNPSDAEFATVGQKYGTKVETLSVAQIPSHTHIQDAHSHSIVMPGTLGGSQQQLDSDFAGGGSLSAGVPTWSTNMSAFANAAYAAATVATNQYTGGNGAHNNIQPSIVKMSAIKYTPSDPAAVSLPAGTSIQGYWSSAPSGYALEDGSAVSRTTYASLFAVIGTTYGAGDGSTTFNLPDSRGRAGVNLSSSDAEFNTMGEKYGEKTHTLTIAEMPSHTHIQDAHLHTIVMPGTLGGNQQRIYGDYAGGGSLSSGTPNLTSGMSLFANAAYAAATVATNQNTGGGGSHNNIQPSIVKLSAIKLTAGTSSGTDLVPGTSVSGYWTSAPTGYLIENGAAVSRTTYASLFSVIGTTYGAGDGSTTFNLPDSRGRVSVNLSPSDAEFNTMGEKYGEKAHTLTIAEMPSHTHIQDAHSHSVVMPGTRGGSQQAIYGDYAGGGSLSAGSTNLTSGMSGFASNAYASATTATNQYTGGGSAHNNIQPSIVKLFVIKY